MRRLTLRAIWPKLGKLFPRRLRPRPPVVIHRRPARWLDRRRDSWSSAPPYQPTTARSPTYDDLLPADRDSPDAIEIERVPARTPETEAQVLEYLSSKTFWCRTR